MSTERYEVGPDGRAPKPLRDAFDQHVERGAASATDAPEGLECARRLLACTRVLPGPVSDALELPPATRYADGAKQVLLRSDPAAAEQARELAWERWRSAAASSAAARTAAAAAVASSGLPDPVRGLLPWRR